MATWLRLNRGTTYDPFNLHGVKCVLRAAWRPGVAKRRRSQMGGRPFSEVEEALPLRIQSKVSGSEALDELARLIETLEQARAWELGATVDPVILEYLPDEFGSQATPLKVETLYTKDAESLLELRPGFDQLLQAFIIDFELPLRRGGQWLDAEETPAASSSVANPGAMTVTFANNARLPSPTKLAFLETPTHVTANARGFILTADQSDKIVLVEAENIATAGSWTTQAGSASGGNYKRYTGTTQSLVTVSSAISFNPNARLFAVFMNARNSSSGNYSYAVKATLGTAGGHNTSLARAIIVPASANTAEVYFVGMFALPATVKTLSLEVTPNGGGSANNGLEIDYFVIQAVDDYTRAVAFGTTSVFQDLTLDPRWLVRPNPVLYANDGTDPKYLDYRGDANILSVGTSLTAWLLGTPGDTTNFYLVHQTIGATRLSFSLTATRRVGYLTPQ